MSIQKRESLREHRLIFNLQFQLHNIIVVLNPGLVFGTSRGWAPEVCGHTRAIDEVRSCHNSLREFILKKCGYFNLLLSTSFLQTKDNKSSIGTKAPRNTPSKWPDADILGFPFNVWFTFHSSFAALHFQCYFFLLPPDTRFHIRVPPSGFNSATQWARWCIYILYLQRSSVDMILRVIHLINCFTPCVMKW